ncbi:MAG: crossover junction endodeoxyribonuclease [Desulfobacteraceae bacterium]|nr:MAG: crossover junction endodeoxyribonuclease [Desulfobacteraceae bacterium]
MTKIIGIDPGLAATGVAIVQGEGSRVAGYSFGTIHTSCRLAVAHRLDQIYLKLFDLLQDESPDLMVVEDVFSLEKYPISGITLGKVSGVVLLAGCRTDVPVVELPVRETKKILTGNGKATKDQVEKSVRHYLQMTTPIRPAHAADAMALALIGLFRYRRPAAKERNPCPLPEQSK